MNDAARADSERTVPIQIWLEPDQAELVKAECAERGEYITNFFEELCERYFGAKWPERRRRPRLRRVS